MKATRYGFAFSLALLAAAPAIADTVIVNENFDSYADTNAFLAQWGATVGNGSAAADPAELQAGILTDDPLSTFDFPGLQGKAVDHIGAAVGSGRTQVNQYGGVINQGNGQNPLFTINPSATQSVFLSADIFESGGGNERMTVGLRHVGVAGTTVTTTNLLDIGFYNSNSADPTVVGSANPAQNAVAGSPGFYNGRGYGARVINFGAVSAPLLHQPDWQYFRTGAEVSGDNLGFAQELDRATDTDEFVSIGDVGAGWHQYTATITPTEVTITIDLFRDGLRNTSRTVDPESGVRPGTPGYDAVMVYPIATNALGFNSLRIGGPSGLSSAGAGSMAFDNIVLKMIDVAAPAENADFNGDNIVDGKDFLIWQRGFGAAGALATGDANNDTLVNDADLAIFKTQFGTDPTPAVGAVAAVPEPTTIALAGVALVGTLAAARRRK